MLNFFKQFLVYGLASVLSKIAAVFLLPLYTNALSKEEYGAMAMIMAMMGIIDLFSNLNIHSGVARDYYEKNIDRIKLVSTGFFSIIFFSIIVFLILFITRNVWITVLKINSHEKAFIIMLCTIPTGSLFSYFGILTRYKQKATLFFIGNILQLLIQILLTVYFVLIIKIGIVGVFYGILFGQLASIVFFYFLNREDVNFVFSKKLIKRILAFSLPTLPAILAGWIDSSLGQILIGKYISLEDAGEYSIALRIVSVFLIIQVALNNVWGPYVYENYNNINFKNNVLKCFKSISLLLIIVSFNISILSDHIILLLSNSNYLNSSNYLILLTIPMSLNILIIFVNIGATIGRKTKYLSYSSILGSLINLLLLIAYLPKYGVVTVPIALMISRLLSYIFLSHFTKKEINLNFPIKNIVILILSNIFLFFIKSILELEFELAFFIICLSMFNILFLLYFTKHYNLKSLLIAGPGRSRAISADSATQGRERLA